MRLFSAIFLVAGLSLYGCATTRAPPRIDLPAPYTDQRVRVTVDGLWKDGDGTVSGVSGTATNISGHDFITCQIGLDLLDVSGVKVSSAVAVTTGLKAGQTWRFQATLMNAYAVAFKSVAPGHVIAVPLQTRTTGTSTDGQGDYMVREGGYCTRNSQCVVGTTCRSERCIVD
jgi:hypothetical protein